MAPFWLLKLSFFELRLFIQFFDCLVVLEVFIMGLKLENKTRLFCNDFKAVEYIEPVKLNHHYIALTFRV